MNFEVCCLHDNDGNNLILFENKNCFLNIDIFSFNFGDFITLG